VVLDERPKLFGALVIGRVRLEDEVVLGVEHGAQLHGRVAAVVEHVDVVELDSGLHHQGDDAWPDVSEAEVGEGRPVRVDGPACPVGGCRGEVFQCFVGAAGDRYLGADDVHRAR
jgi:hypothetical protein